MDLRNHRLYVFDVEWDVESYNDEFEYGDGWHHATVRKTYRVLATAPDVATAWALRRESYNTDEKPRLVGKVSAVQVDTLLLGIGISGEQAKPVDGWKSGKRPR